MKDDRSDSNGGHRSWLEKLSFALLGEPKDQDELLDMLRDAHERHLLDLDALHMMEGVMEVSEMQVRDVMLPRGQMVVVEQDWTLERVLDEVLESGHSRFPVIRENRDDIIGVLLVKDLLRFLAKGNGEFNVQELLRPAKFIPESKRLNALLKEFRSTRLHMAIVVDEYGGVAGLVTIEDVLEQIVGEIDDEHDIDEEAPFIRLQGDNKYLVKALTPVEDFNDYFKADLSDEKADTIGGLVMMELGRLPKRGEVAQLGPYRFQVLRADNRRLHLLELTLRHEAEAD
ncbi:MAG: CBS domain-containing protein [Gammaproteobacteria bacterium]|nr:CBS domain-containing protein [Gammaproteobacteria bacterium]MCP5423828.1 CBS domain-containing protein [Gammaproteobacteria bacterium]